MKALRFSLLAALLAAGLFAMVSAGPAAAGIPTPVDGCAEMNFSGFDGYYPLVTYCGGPVAFAAGDTVIIKAKEPDTATVPTKFSFWLGPDEIATADYPGTLKYVFPADATAIDFSIRTAPSIWGTFTASCQPAAAVVEPVAPVPGCDLGMQLTSDSAVGLFVATTDVFWGPSLDATTGISMPAGKTAWVLGMDASGEFYKFVWSCTYLWAPVNTIGPNPDDVWHSTPLPATVVE